MPEKRRLRRWLMYAGGALAVLLIAAAIIWREDIFQTTLDPKTPYQTYEPPPAPDYASAKAWALLPKAPQTPQAGEPGVDVFFVYPTTYNGGKNWNAPLDDAQTSRDLARVMLPNYAGPFVRLGRMFAPRYRQASLYAEITLREDSRDARKFAYADVRDAFRYWLDHYAGSRPFVIVGVDQGGFLASRLLTDEIGPNPALRARLAGAYLIATITAADLFAPGSPVPACERRQQAGCVVAYAQITQGRVLEGREMLDRALVWRGEEVENIADRPALCVNPLTGSVGAPDAQARLNLGAVNATGLEWAARPAFMQRQVGARCEGGLLWISKPRSPSLQPPTAWPDHLKAPPFNLFYADLEADATARIAAQAARTAQEASGSRSSNDATAPPPTSAAR